MIKQLECKTSSSRSSQQIKAASNQRKKKQQQTNKQAKQINFSKTEYHVPRTGHICIIGIKLKLACNEVHVEKYQLREIMTFAFEKTSCISIS